jgi:hypothetical protein
MANFRVRIRRLEAKQWEDAWEQLCRYVNGRSEEDLEFFCVHGYLPDVPIPGRSVDTSLWQRRTWEDYKRTFAGRSVLELEFFCVHGTWPERGEGLSHGKP